MRSLIDKGLISKILIGIILLILIVVPIVRMLVYIDKESFDSVFGSKLFVKNLINSLTSTAVATVISIALGYLLAWAITRTDIKCKYLFTILITLPMLIPSISHGMGLIILFGNNGIITRLLGASNSIYGFWGVVVGSVLYSFPIAFIMIADILKYEDQAPYEAADVLGIPKIRQFTAITYPYIRKPMISVIFAVFTMIVTDYGVPLAVGGKFKTLPVMLYEEAVGQLNYSVGSVIGLVLLVPALAAFLFDLFNKDKGNASYVQRNYHTKNKWRDPLGYTVMSVCSFMVILVVFSFIIVAQVHEWTVALKNTVAHVHHVAQGGALQIGLIAPIKLASTVVDIVPGILLAPLLVNLFGQRCNIRRLGN